MDERTYFLYAFFIRLTYHYMNRNIGLNKCNWAFYVTYQVHLTTEFMSFDILLFLENYVLHFSLISLFYLILDCPKKGMTSWWNSNLFVEFTAFRNPLDHESIAVTQPLISHKKTKGMQISRKKKSNICFCKKQKKRLKTSYLGGSRSKPYMVMRNITYRTIKASIRVAMIILECNISDFRHAITI